MPSKSTIAVSVAFLLALINQILAARGLSPLPFDSSQLTNTVSAVFTIVTGIAAWWHNNSVTEPAIKADQFMKELKKSR